jgi:flavin reductase (DIM6/NTAB) family NADH-FMN oxidoreductase RutF
VSVSLRRATYTYDNILSRRAFTVSLPTEDFVKEIDYVGIVSGREVDKFDTLGLTPIKSDIVDAPYVAEFPLVLECRLLRKVEIGLHTQFIGEIVDIKAEDSVLDENGRPHIERVKPVIFSSGPRAYYGLGAFLGDAFSIGRKV